MGRLDRYKAEYEDDDLDTEKNEQMLSRVSKHLNMYDEMYMNKSLVDVNTILDEENVEEPKEKIENDDFKSEEYEEKSYDVNEYLEKAHEKISPDDAKRDINNPEFKEQEDEIRKLIDSINEKEEDDFFQDLKGDNEDTMIGAKFKTDEFNDSIYETLQMEKIIEEKTILDHALSDNTVLNLEKENENKLDNTFEEILKSDNRIRHKRKQLPIIIFCVTLFILIVVIIIIILK